MANVFVNEDSLSDIADAIRGKLGVQTTYKPSEMAEAIESISGGGITPTGTIEITQNGVVDVTNYASADVDVPTGSTPVINSLSVTENGTYTAPTGVDGYSPITVNVSGGIDYLVKKITNQTVENYTADCSATNLTSRAFDGWANLQNVILKNTGKIGSYCFNGCNGLLSVTVLATGNSPYSNSYVYYCNNLKTVYYGYTKHFGESLGGLGPSHFATCPKLDTLIINTEDVLALNHVNAFNNTCFKSGGTGGTIYIPKSLYDHLGDGTALDYKAATNWSTIEGYGTITWAKIEGSYYETHYADGSTIPIA